jgi:hypothetical protein
LAGLGVANVGELLAGGHGIVVAGAVRVTFAPGLAGSAPKPLPLTALLPAGHVAPQSRVD